MNNSHDSDKNFRRLIRQRQEKLTGLCDFQKGYTADKFIVDLVSYFGPAVDFDLDKIHESVKTKGYLNNLISAAKKNQTHPVTEFIQELFKDVTCEARINLDINKPNK